MHIGHGIRLPSYTRRPFRPTDISDCALWVRGDLGITLSTDRVTAWADQSGNGNDLTEATYANMPGYTASDPDWGGNPSVVFVNPRATRLQSAALSLDAHTVVMVCKCYLVGYACVLGTDSGAQSSYVYGTVGASVHHQRGASGRSSKNRAANWLVDNTKKFWARRVGTTHASHGLWIDGVDQSMTDVVAQDPSGGPESVELYLGSNQSHAAAMSASVVEILLYSRRLTDAEMASLTTRSQSLWGTP